VRPVGCARTVRRENGCENRSTKRTLHPEVPGVGPRKVQRPGASVSGLCDPCLGPRIELHRAPRSQLHLAQPAWAHLDWDELAGVDCASGSRKDHLPRKPDQARARRVVRLLDCKRADMSGGQRRRPAPRYSPRLMRWSSIWLMEGKGIGLLPSLIRTRWRRGGILRSLRPLRSGPPPVTTPCRLAEPG